MTNSSSRARRDGPLRALVGRGEYRAASSVGHRRPASDAAEWKGLIMSALLTRARSLLHHVGVDVRRWVPAVDPHVRRQAILAGADVDVVVDVGANTGQYGAVLRRHGYRGRLLSLEPMSREFAQLRAAAAADCRWEAWRCAAGAEPGEITINVAGNSVSSSALPMLDAHADAAPRSVYVGTDTAPVDRLDALLADRWVRWRHPFLKVDTQGLEREVLSGAGEDLRQFVGVEMEMSLTPLYEGQMLLPEALETLDKAGFRLAGLHPAFVDQRSGETYQVDGVFLRNP